MHTFSQILFPVDFSERSKDTARFVASIARKFQSTVTLLHVLEDFSAFPAPESLGPLLREHRESALLQFCVEDFRGLNVIRLVEQGDPADLITRYAEIEKSDLIVLPTHGLGRFRMLLLGSVTAKVLHDTSCPVWTTVHSDELPPAGPDQVRNIVCGLDLHAEPVRILKAAADVALNFGATVHVVHAIPATETKPENHTDEGLKHFLIDKARQDIAQAQHQAGTDWPICIQSGPVPQALRESALSMKADLLIIGRGHIQNHFGRLRTHVGAVIGQSPCPVLSV